MATSQRREGLLWCVVGQDGPMRAWAHFLLLLFYKSLLPKVDKTTRTRGGASQEGGCADDCWQASLKEHNVWDQSERHPVWEGPWHLSQQPTNVVSAVYVYCRLHDELWTKGFTRNWDTPVCPLHFPAGRRKWLSKASKLYSAISHICY